MIFSREFSMPNEATFEMAPISRLLDKWLPNHGAVIIDPFARHSLRGTITNDLNPRSNARFHLEAREFLVKHCELNSADAALFDPPYSPRQIAECYRMADKKVTLIDSQNARLCKDIKDLLDQRLKTSGLVITCGWNSTGMGKDYELLEILLVNHGASHNDTIVLVERKLQGNLNG